MAKCRDCNRCTEVAAKGLALGVFRFTWWLLTFWNLGLFRKKCPQCHHAMSQHQMVGGRFQD